MFAMACIERQMEIEQRKKIQSQRADGEEERDLEEETAQAGRGWCSIQ